MSERVEETLEYGFDRYRKGVLMAEGVTISRATDLADATQRAALLCPKGDVLVYRAAADATPPADMSEKVEAAARAMAQAIGYDFNDLPTDASQPRLAKPGHFGMSQETLRDMAAAADAVAPAAGLCERLIRFADAEDNGGTCDLQFLTSPCREAAAALARLSADVERLTRERDLVMDAFLKNSHKYMDLIGERDAAEASVTELEGLIAFAESCEPPRG